jgi:predicted metallo-beta-lactamase superfamily hydrolase
MATRNAVKKSKVSTKKAGATKAKAAPVTASKARVRVRMYRQGLGDCFLITFPQESGNDFHMMIDCGVVLGTATPDLQTIKDAVADIKKETGKHLNLVVVTHEHWDHVSGFSMAQARGIFDDITIDQVWMAWTEDPTDALATRLRKERRSAEDALRLAAQRLAANGNSIAEHVNSLVEFFGAAGGSTGDALDYIKRRVKKPWYLKPGEPPIKLDAIPGVRFFVMGPPHDEKLIKKSNPGKSDAYGLDALPGGSHAFLISALNKGMGMADGAEDLSVNAEPFDAEFAIPLARTKNIDFFDCRFYGDCKDGSIYDKNWEDRNGNVVGRDVTDQSWRRIDSTWLDASEPMALQLDSATNNTSLVLAIELTETKDVLLFPGDAQAGNWLSWQDLNWSIKGSDTDDRETVTGPDLLARTIFYKVGHHGSHNATLKEKGLELMVNNQLMAMIPVDHDMAVKKRWERMPLPALVDRIRERAHGRVLRIDDKVKSNEDLVKLKPPKGDPEEWTEFTNRVIATDLYYEITI